MASQDHSNVDFTNEMQAFKNKGQQADNYAYTMSENMPQAEALAASLRDKGIVSAKSDYVDEGAPAVMVGEQDFAKLKSLGAQIKDKLKYVSEPTATWQQARENEPVAGWVKGSQQGDC